MSVTYEWLVETVDEHGDIVDVDHREVCPALSTLKQGQCLALVCEEYRGSRHSKGWAYVTYDALPESCLDAYGAPMRRVPARYRREFDRAQHKANLRFSEITLSDGETSLLVHVYSDGSWSPVRCRRNKAYQWIRKGYFGDLSGEPEFVRRCFEFITEAGRRNYTPEGGAR